MQNETIIKLADLGKVAPFVLSEAERHEIEEEMHHYPDTRAASIGALKIVQKHRGWVPDGAIAPVAKMIGTDAADLEGVATFYSLIFRQPVGRNVITVCDSISCHLTGYDQLRIALQAKLGIGLGQTTPDQRFTLLPICCLGNCDHGPTMMIGDDLHSDVDPDGLDKILGGYK
ncbi:MAG: NADH-quinone oxidoreductase subunit NuoE [Panacagrimonas sp.]